MNTIALDLVPAFFVGLFSSVHCVAMCGPLATLGCRSRMTGGAWAPLAFSVGKLFSYSLLGFCTALLGSLLLDGIEVRSTVAWVSLAGGVLMIAALVFAYLKPTSGGFLTKLSMNMSRRALRWGKWMAPGLGLAAAFLPCGVLYAMVARSAAAVSPWNGMLIMQAFGVGTMPALLGVSVLIQKLPERWSRYGNSAASALIAITALVLLWRGLAGLAAEQGPPPCCAE